MHRQTQPGESQVVNNYNYTYGGVGGNGGMGGTQGGGGGAGEGPTMNYDFYGVENLTMNNHDLQIHDSDIYSVSGDVSLMIQDHRPYDVHVPPAADGGFELSAGWWDFERLGREVSGPTRNLQDEIRTRSAPYHIPSRTRSSAIGPNTENPTFSPRNSFSSEFSPPFDYLPHMSSQSIHGSTFNVVRGNVNSIQHQGEFARQFLHRVGACDAFHNSAERFPQPKCHPETRTEMLDHLLDWTRGIERPWNFLNQIDSAHWKHDTTRILWLHGPAGAGKSAIAQSLCQKLEAEGHLVASFFFKREHASRGNATRLFATIAYQLAALPELNGIISRNLANDPAVVNKSFSVQLEKLIVEPCRLANFASPPIVIIDGLDECEGQHVQEEILRSFANPIFSPLPVYLLIASRPEPHISETFQENSLKGQHRRMNVNQSFEDVCKYLCDEFARIHTNHRQTMANIPSPWPSSSVMDELVRKSSGYFVYASTVIKFIDDKNYRPSDRLDIVTGLAEPDSGSPFAALDQLYSQILSQASAHPQLLHILAVIASDLRYGVKSIERLLELKPGDVRLALRGLHSMISISKREDNGDSDFEKPSHHHASFRDYLQDSTRSGIFYIDGSQLRIDLALFILKAYSLQYNNMDPRDDNLDHRDDRPLAAGLTLSPLLYITGAPPVPEILSALNSCNPDFLFGRYGDWDNDIDNLDFPSALLVWLKDIQPPPVDLIELWEDYNFMYLCSTLWSEEDNCYYPPDFSYNYTQILAQAPLQLIRILQACRIALWPRPFTFCRRVLDLSWTEMREAICYLRPVISEDKGGLRQLCYYAPPPLFPELTYDYLRAMRSIVEHKLPRIFGWHFSCWGEVVRLCPPCPALLKELKAMAHHLDHWDPREPRWNEEALYHAAQWLKTFPEDQRDLVLMTRFEELAGNFHDDEQDYESEFESWRRRRRLEHRVPDSDDDSEDEALSE